MGRARGTAQDDFGRKNVAGKPRQRGNLYSYEFTKGIADPEMMGRDMEWDVFHNLGGRGIWCLTAARSWHRVANENLARARKGATAGAIATGPRVVRTDRPCASSKRRHSALASSSSVWRSGEGGKARARSMFSSNGNCSSISILFLIAP
jgi:hypothetical protein